MLMNVVQKAAQLQTGWGICEEQLTLAHKIEEDDKVIKDEKDKVIAALEHELEIAKEIVKPSWFSRIGKYTLLGVGVVAGVLIAK